jgi:hypothetical protein
MYAMLCCALLCCEALANIRDIYADDLAKHKSDELALDIIVALERPSTFTEVLEFARLEMKAAKEMELEHFFTCCAIIMCLRLHKDYKKSKVLVAAQRRMEKAVKSLTIYQFPVFRFRAGPGAGDHQSKKRVRRTTLGT